MSRENYTQNTEGLNSINQILSRAGHLKQPSRLSESIELLDDLDLKWSQSPAGRTPHTYFDYVFSGQDIIAYIDGTDPTEKCIPIMELGFNIEQQKVPVYGFWDHTFSAVMRGTRLISGVVRIATVSTHYMVDKIAETAESRVATNPKYQSNPIRGLDRDEKNINEYWSRNIDPDAAYNEGGRTLFSAHPPFNLVINFNMQSASVNESPLELANRLYQDYNEGPYNIQDYNERLVNTSGSAGTMSYLLENTELTSMQTEFSPAGDVVAETYSFFARDMRTPRS